MPFVLSMFLSWYLSVVLLWMYLGSAVIVFIGFWRLKIQRRTDVKIRGFLMAATFTFASHGIGAILCSSLELGIRVISGSFRSIYGIGVMVVSWAAVITCMVYLLEFLFDKLYIEKSVKVRLLLTYVLVFSPYYYLGMLWS